MGSCTDVEREGRNQLKCQCESYQEHMAVQTAPRQLQPGENSRAQFTAGNIEPVQVAKEPDVSCLEDSSLLVYGSCD